MAEVRATAAQADRVAAMYTRDKGLRVKDDAAGLAHVRAYCAAATPGMSPGQLDRLAGWVLRRVAR